VIQKEVGDRLAIKLLEGEYPEGGTVKVDVENDEISLV
jgi:ATP-dependent Clp protease ATP-binding subunit ClpA